MGVLALTSNHVFALNKLTSTSLSGNEGFMEKISKKTCDLQTLKGADLFSIYRTALSNWQHNGYEAHGSNYYVCQPSEIVLFPLHLHHESAGSLDQAILCFAKNQADKWVKLKALSGFDLEALNVAATGLQLHNPAVNLNNYLLPILSSTHAEPFCFHTLKGDVFIKTFIADNNSNTEIIVKEGSKIVFQQKIISKHNLS